MRTLRLVALSEDGESLVLMAEGPDGADGEKFALPIDDRLRAAARGDARRLIQIDVDMGTELPPRIIQSRIRAGETPEQVAASSGTRVERIMRFAHPVIQERERVADQAREARVRLSDGGPGVALQQFMVERLRLIDTDIDAVTWDAFRGDDGSWVATGAWRAGEKSGTTRWRFDLPSRTVTPVDAATTDFAEGTRLVRVVPEVAPAPRSRPVSVVRAPGAEPPAPAPVEDDEDEHVRDVHAPDGSPEDDDMTALLDEVAEHDTVVLGRTGEDGAEDPRARIPAWEDIVFGVRRNR
ncbi:septation protein SepH [Blastococcus atacamensis]|uniref:septation protein SepH n=1 Tax=Blastococcus atacamensis TaxID=2070508 RepID=UPI000CEBF9EC|nr:septation protein SepH [Blastococcus atacamensis]